MSEPTAAFQIFNTPFLVKVAAHFLYSKEYMEVMGIPTSGDKLRDRIALEEKRRFYSSVDGMVELHARGAVVELVNPDSDAVTIYRLVRTLLNEWKMVTEMVGAPEPPLEDLLKLEGFAEGIYPIASRYLMQGEKISTPFDEMYNQRHNDRPAIGRRRHQVKGEIGQGFMSEAKAMQDEMEIVPRQSVITDSIARSVFYKRGV